MQRVVGKQATVICGDENGTFFGLVYHINESVNTI